MISSHANASTYTDFQGLAELRVAARQKSPEALRETARQFEAIFLQSLLKAMRDASPGGGMFDSEQTEFYREIYDRQLAIEMVKGQGLGISRMLIKDMGGTDPAAPVPLQQEINRTSLPPDPQPEIAQTVALIPLDGKVTPVVVTAAEPVMPLIEITPDERADFSASRIDLPDWHPKNPITFIRELLPHARKGADDLGVQPEVLVAQAALETGWGQKMIRHEDGRNSFNLFGIKADARWQGERVTVTTLEYSGGVAKKQRAAFRSYASLDDAVAGYVDFLRANPRYKHALEQAGDPDTYLRELKDAGYATDPYYVEKIRSIMDGDSFDQVTDQLALSDQGQH